MRCKIELKTIYFNKYNEINDRIGLMYKIFWDRMRKYFKYVNRWYIYKMHFFSLSILVANYLKSFNLSYTNMHCYHETGLLHPRLLTLRLWRVVGRSSLLLFCDLLVQLLSGNPRTQYLWNTFHRFGHFS